jgi:hypothetical protein
MTKATSGGVLVLRGKLTPPSSLSIAQSGVIESSPEAGGRLSWSVAASPDNGLPQTFERPVDRPTDDHPWSRDDDHVERLVGEVGALLAHPRGDPMAGELAEYAGLSDGVVRA